MKKLFALLLALTLMLSLAACGGDDKEAASGDNTSTTQTDGFESTGASDATDGTETSTPATDSTESTSTPEETSKPTETTKPSETTKPTETTKPEHKHSYTSKVTKEATCGADGTKSFTCSCGDTYTEKISATGQHSWGSWSTETKAYVGKDGTEKRTCSTCSTSETKERTANAIANSFDDGGLAYIALQSGRINGYSLLEYASHELHEHLHHPVPMETIFNALSERFNITAELRADMIAAIEESSKYSNQFGYDKTNGTLELQYPGEHYGDSRLLGYVHNGGNNYTIYCEFGEYDYRTDDFTYVTLKATLEYNKVNGKPNKYISFEMVNSTPNNMVACPKDERGDIFG